MHFRGAGSCKCGLDQAHVQAAACRHPCRRVHAGWLYWSVNTPDRRCARAGKSQGSSGALEEHWSSDGEAVTVRQTQWGSHSGAAMEQSQWEVTEGLSHWVSHSGAVEQQKAAYQSQWSRNRGPVILEQLH
eukprot:1159862-Pelagomonas_calceolata.AAC.2